MAEPTSSKTPERLAIQAAIKANWPEAIKANQEILATEPKNTAALNRLGIAYLKSHQPREAKKFFLKILKLDPFNTIAKTNLKKASPKYSREYDNTKELSNHTFSFIKEPGKSIIVPLGNIGEPNIVATLYTGLPVDLKISGRKVKVATAANKYIGCLPDDISIHLIRLMKAGYKYQTLIKSSDTANIQVYVKEVKSSKRLKGAPSFSSDHSLDDLEVSSGTPSQPPLEIYDPLMGSES